MYPLLILREEFLCLLILLFLTFISKKYRMGTDGRVFNRLLFFAHIFVRGTNYSLRECHKKGILHYNKESRL